MRKIRIYGLAFMVLLVISSTVAISQTESDVEKPTRHDAKDISYGVKSGMSVSTFSKGERVVAKSGVVVGVFGTIKLSSGFGVSGEVLLSQQGCEFSGFSGSIDLIYLNFPILANYYVKQVEGLTVKVGLQPALLVLSDALGIKEGFRSVDFAIPIGVSYELDFGLLFDARYNIGLTDAFKGGWTFNRSNSGNNMVFQLTVGYRF